VQQGPNGSVVYVVGEGDKVEVRDIKATSWRRDQWLVEEGLKVGEQVMIDGFLRVMPGAQVKPVAATGATTAPPPSGLTKPEATK
jgi:membrane fusion protein (multidrug efflux system)